MQSLRTTLSVLLSATVHASTLVTLMSGAPTTYLPVNTFAPLEVLPLPAPPKPQEAEPLPARERHVVTRARPLQANLPRPKPMATEQQATSASPEQPVALVGFSLSNAGVGLASGNGSGFAPVLTRTAPVETARVASSPPNPTNLGLTALSDLSRKPGPPPLAQALARSYPPHLRASGVEGQALVRVIVGAAGEVRTTALLSETHLGFGQACQTALSNSRWVPPLDRAGNPTATSLQYRCRFTVGL
jgi:hypothetical protein